MATTALRPRERDALIQSLRSGVKNLALRTQPEGGTTTNAIRWLRGEFIAKIHASDE
jgi:hypothetical protein